MAVGEAARRGRACRGRRRSCRCSPRAGRVRAGDPRSRRGRTGALALAAPPAPDLASRGHGQPAEHQLLRPVQVDGGASQQPRPRERAGVLDRLRVRARAAGDTPLEPAGVLAVQPRDLRGTSPRGRRNGLGGMVFSLSEGRTAAARGGRERREARPRQLRGRASPGRCERAAADGCATQWVVVDVDLDSSASMCGSSSSRAMRRCWCYAVAVCAGRARDLLVVGTGPRRRARAAAACGWPAARS